jgi:hypothetical protein
MQHGAVILNLDATPVERNAAHACARAWVDAFAEAQDHGAVRDCAYSDF